MDYISQDRLTLVGDVKDKYCYVMDDVIDATHSFIDSAELLKGQGAAKVFVVATHGILSDDSLQEFESCPYIDQVIVTNAYPISYRKRSKSTKLHEIDISGVLAEAIRRTHNGESISYLFHSVV